MGSTRSPQLSRPIAVNPEKGQFLRIYEADQPDRLTVGAMADGERGRINLRLEGDLAAMTMPIDLHGRLLCFGNPQPRSWRM
jgi:hypothetical protein